MIGLFIASLVFGLVLMAVSFFGGHHGDAHVGHDHDSAKPEHQLPFLSLRFWTYASFAFGATGIALMAIGLGSLLALGIASPFAASIGFGAFAIFRWLNSTVVSGETGLRPMIGMEARVILPIRPGAVGKIAIETLAGRVELRAKTFDASVIEPGRKVLVANIDGDVADVSVLPGTTDPT